MADGLLGMPPGGDLAPLLGMLGQVQRYTQPTPEEQAAARRQQLAMLFASLIGAPKGGEWDRLGQGAMYGLQARQQALSGAAEARRQAMHDAATALQLQAAMQGAQSKAQEQQLWAGAPSTPVPVSGPPAAFQAPGGASALMGGAMGGAQPPTANLPTQVAPPTGSARDAERALLQGVIERAQKAGRGDIALQAMDRLAKLEPPPDEVFKVDYANDVSGKPMTYVVFKSGRSATLPGIVPREKIEYLNTGGAFLPKTEYGGVIPGAAPIPATMTPGEVASNQVALGNLGVARGNLGIAQQRLGLEQQAAAAGKWQYDPKRGMVINPAGAAAQPVMSGGKPIGPEPTDTTQAIGSIRREANALPDVQNYRAALPMLKSAASAPDTRAGDIDIIYAVGKAMDPNSVVREGEMNLIIKSGSPAQQVMGVYNYVVGGGKLTKPQRDELVATLRNRVAQLKAAHDAALKPYVAQASALGLPQEQLFIQPPGEASAAAQPPTREQLLEEARRRGLVK